MFGQTTASAEDSAMTVKQWQGSSGLMRLAALQKGGISTSEAPLARGLLGQMGYGASVPKLVHLDLRIAPIFGYDSNLNGGFSADQLVIGGLPFTLAPETVAKPGLYFGARLDARADWAIAPRWTAGLGASLRHSRAVEAPLFKSALSLRGCLGRFTGDRSEVRLCADAGSSHTPQSISHRRGVEAGINHAWAMGDALVEADLWLRQERALSSDQWQGGFGLRAVLVSGNDIGLSYALGAPVKGELVSRHAVSLHTGFTLLGQPTQLSASWSEASGGAFLGVPRSEISRSIGLSRSFKIGGAGQKPVTITPALRWFETRAGHALISRKGVDLSLNVRF